MRSSLLLLALTLPLCATPAWEDPAVNRTGTELPRATFFPFPTPAGLLSGKPSPWTRPLDGDWKFHWSADFDQRPADFFEPRFDDSGWGTLPVPSCWQLHGHGTPIYTNITYPFTMDPPRVSHPHGRPVGSYRHCFRIPEEWKNRRVFLHFGGVSSAYTAWLNGSKLGYAEDTRSPSEFDLSGHLEPGENLLAVEVLRWCDGSYLEDQDGWRLSGIFREVTLFSRPAAHVRDFFVTTDLDEAYRDASWSIAAQLRNQGDKPQELTLSAKLLNSAGRQIATATAPAATVGAGEETTVRLSAPVAEPAKWTHETPNLYHTVLTLTDDAGTLLESVGCRTGFREVEIRNRTLLLNGRPIVINGVNRVEHDVDGGKTVPRASTERDVMLLKEANFNCVRTAHYPHHTDFYDLCDQAGILVIDEANVESHGMRYGPESLAKQPEWRQAHVERAVNMVHRDRNHPCVLLWSHGNEAGNGPNIVAMNDAVHALDPTRPTHYQFADEPVCCDTVGGWARGPKKEMWGRYLTLEELQGYLDADDPRPLVHNEYAHAMGNAMGNLAEYQELYEAHPEISGGCIWDWVDQGLWKTHRDGSRFIAYGGDFGDRPNDGAFCLNGVILADRSETAKLAECRKVFQPLAFDLRDKGIGITNKNFFADSSRYSFSWKLLLDGTRAARGELEVPVIEARASAVVPVPGLPDSIKTGNREAVLTIEARRRDHDAAHPAAFEQFILNPWNFDRTGSVDAGGVAPEVRQTRASLTLTASENALSFDRKTGLLTTWTIDDRPFIVSGPEPHFWRAPTLNDGDYPPEKNVGKFNKNAKYTDQWVACGLDKLEHELVSLDHSMRPTAAVVTAKHRHTSPDGKTVFDTTLVHSLDSTGGLHIDAEVTPSGRQPVSLPRVGLQLRLPKAFDQVTWYGRGPGESYPDRKSGMPLGSYSGPVDEQFVNYPVPQENGNKTDLRWIRVGPTDGRGLLALGDRPLCASVHRYETRNLAEARHTYDLKPCEHLILHLDYLNGPLGNASCGKVPPLPRYQLKPAPMKWAVTLRSSK